MPAISYPDMFDQGVPPEIQQSILLGMRRSYRESVKNCKKVAGPLWPNLLPFTRWAKTDLVLHNIAKRYESLGIIGRLEKSNGGTLFATLQGGNVILTASSTHNESEVPRSSTFRDTFARRSGLLFEMDYPPKPDDPLYAILVHAPAEGNPSQLGMANIRFPLSNGREWADGRIRLLDRFPRRRRARESFLHEEKIEDEVLATLRDDLFVGRAKERQA